jgi:hypothetical protein
MKRFEIFVTVAITSLMAIPASTLAYQTLDIQNGGKLTGKVGFSGNDPEPQIFSITKDNEACGTGKMEIDFVKVNNEGLLDVVVFLDKVKAGKPFPELATEIAQNKCVFEPFLSIMHNNNGLLAINNDPILHNVHAYELFGRAKRTVFNISQPDIGSNLKHIKLRRGTAMKVECDAHDFMHSFVFVAKNPYYARVDIDGNFSIDNIPPGEYVIKAWHVTLGEKKATVLIEPNGSTSVNFNYSL